jgi:hypothetical protein
MKKIFFCAFLLFSQNFLSFGQQKTVFKTGKIPPLKSLKGMLFLAGNFNNWNPADTAWQLHLTPDDAWQIVKTLPSGIYNFKVTRGLGKPLNAPRMANRLTTEMPELCTILQL